MTTNLFSEKVEAAGWIFYLVAPETVIYRGDSLLYIGEKHLGTLEYFSDLQTSKIYGLVSAYKATDGLKLLAMDELTNLEKLYNQAPENVREAIESSFGYSDDNKEIKRESDYDNDFIVARYVCSQGLDGYAHEAIASETEADFHPELAICNPGDKLELSRRLPYSDKEISEKVSQNRLHIYAREEKHRKLKRPERSRIRDEEDDKPVRRGNLFGDDDAEDDKPVRRGNLFGDDDE